MKVGAILFGLAFIVSGIIGIRQDDNFLPTKGVIQSMERTYVATDSNDSDTWEVMVEYILSCDGRDCNCVKKQAHPRRYNYRLGCAFMDK